MGTPLTPGQTTSLCLHTSSGETWLSAGNLSPLAQSLGVPTYSVRKEPERLARVGFTQAVSYLTNHARACCRIRGYAGAEHHSDPRQTAVTAPTLRQFARHVCENKARSVGRDTCCEHIVCPSTVPWVSTSQKAYQVLQDTRRAAHHDMSCLGGISPGTCRISHNDAMPHIVKATTETLSEPHQHHRHRPFMS